MKCIRTLLRLSPALLLFVACNGRNEPTSRSDAEQFGYHAVRTDASGRIVPWNADDPGTAYDDIVDRLWRFWDTMRIDYNGLPYYMNHLVWRPDFNDERGMGGDQFAMVLSSWRLLYAYTGNDRVKENMKFIADHYLTHGLSPADCRWPDLPFPYATLVYSGRFDGDMVLGKGYTQPDKAGSFGWELVQLYRMTERKCYLDHAVRIANTLARNCRKGDVDHSPWPFKVNVFTGEPGRLESNDWSGDVIGASEYTTNYAGTLELFRALSEMGVGDTALYRRRTREVLDWMVRYPLQNQKWGPFFEDVPGWSDTQINAVTFAQFLMNHPELVPDWQRHVTSVFNWVYDQLGNDSWNRYGVRVVDEQTAYRVPGNSHTARQACAELQYVHLTGDSSRYENAVRQLNWATYTVSENGENCYPRDCIWFTDGYGDYIRHYLRAMATCPELAPAGEDHLLSSSSVVQRADYAPHLNKFLVPTVDPSVLDRTRLYYRTADDSGRECIRLTRKPVRLMMEWQPITEGTPEGNRWRWEPLPDGGGLLYVVRVDTRHVSVETE